MPDEDESQRALEFDLIILGAGSGNSLVGPEFDDGRVAILDDGEWFGGTCLNAGCIPTKMFVHVADVVTAVDDGARIGVHARLDRPEWAEVRDRVFGRTDAISQGGFEYRDQRSPGVTVLRESFGFESLGDGTRPHVLASASGTRISAPRVVVATGSRPRPLLAAYDPDPRIHDSSSVMRLDELPERMVILGGGAVAVEFAHVFSAFGVAVTVAVRGDRLLRALDEGIARRFTALARERWELRTGVSVESIDSRGEALRLAFDDGSTLETDLVLVALGRQANSDTIAAASVGIDLHPDGRVAVDSEQRVLSGGHPVSGLFALGDVSSPWQLKHVANHEARLVSHNLRHPGELLSNTLGPVPGALFAHPQIAHFGLTAAEAQAEGREIVTVTQEYGSTAFGWALEDDSGVCILVVGLDGALVGAHIMGPQASILIQPLVQAASAGIGIHGLARSQYWPHPAASEIVENALLKAEEALRERTT
ncbi:MULTISPECIES: mycothione reductase [unclassified Rathayibacter]|uniref:mycothione reductase n=1 Tax=unclassified Rathayibacter TaxID=2609250 RepID=UPI00188C2413|nr:MULTISPECIES: mycothione reductase [unclassified Rathayibacter]MBF4462540.1 mycothione reductase [Rathayibacter sp. VKM Ac-2879]MBF4503417.1 mycothione reductase [Rathayibacter sp. VKM Ac-2878]